MRGARGRAGFFDSDLRRLRSGRGLDERTGVVETFISLGRMVPAIAAAGSAISNRECAQCS
jgi:hypothetical protein